MAKILCKVGGGGGKPLKGNATVADVLDGKTFSNKNSNNLTGAMPNNGAISKTLSAGDSYTVPAGYHDGSGIVIAKTLSSQTVGDAVAASIRSGKTAWVNGTKLTGTIADQGGGTYNPNKGSVRTLASAGKYLTSDVKVNGFSLPAAANLKKGVTFTLYGQSVTGTFEGYTTSPLYIIQNGVVKNLSTNKFNNTSYDSSRSGLSYDLENRWSVSASTINLSSYNYFKIRISTNKYTYQTGYGQDQASIIVGLGTNQSSPSYSTTLTTSSSASILAWNIASYNNSYYIFFKDPTNDTSSIYYRYVYDLFFSTT